MKSIRELRDPAHQADVARIARAVAETVEKICEVNGYDRRAAGVLALRASLDLLLLDERPEELGAWLAQQAADLMALASTGGNA